MKGDVHIFLRGCREVTSYLSQFEWIVGGYLMHYDDTVHHG
jgi:hypothetical protein